MGAEWVVVLLALWLCVFLPLLLDDDDDEPGPNRG